MKITNISIFYKTKTQQISHNMKIDVKYNIEISKYHVKYLL